MSDIIPAIIGAAVAGSAALLYLTVVRIEVAIRDNTRAVRKAAKALSGSNIGAEMRTARAELKRIGDLAAPMSRGVEGLKQSVDAFYSVAVANLTAASRAQGLPSGVRFPDDDGAIFSGVREPAGEENLRAMVESLGDNETLPELGAN